MQYQRFGNQFVLKLDPDEEVMSTLLQFVDRERIHAGYFMAFGAFSMVRLEYFDFNTKQYRDHQVNQQVEVVSLMGNIARAEGKPMIHMHGAVANSHIETFSGHIAEGRVRPTLELFLTKLTGELRREKDPVSGLDLLDLEGGTAQHKKAA